MHSLTFSFFPAAGTSAEQKKHTLLQDNPTARAQKVTPFLEVKVDIFNYFCRAFAVSTMFSTVMPFFASRRSYGADSPN